MSGQRVRPLNTVGGRRVLTVGVDSGADASATLSCQLHVPHRLSRVHGGYWTAIGQQVKHLWSRRLMGSSNGVLKGFGASAAGVTKALAHG